MYPFRLRKLWTQRRIYKQKIEMTPIFPTASIAKGYRLLGEGGSWGLWMIEDHESSFLSLPAANAEDLHTLQMIVGSIGIGVVISLYH